MRRSLADAPKRAIDVFGALFARPIDSKGELLGMATEVDLLNHMLEKHDHSHEEAIDGLVQNAGAVFPPETSLEDTMPSLTAGYALIIIESSKPVGILTKIDVLDYVAGKI